MALSPEDIVNHEFKQALRGYAVQEVDDLLDRLADQVERADRDIEDLRQRLRDADARVTDALATESSLKRTLITAQDAAQRTIDDAQAHAEAVRSEADREATERLEDALARSAAMLEEAETEAVTIRASYRAEQEAAAGRIAELASIEDRYRTELRARLEAHLGALDVLDADGPPGGSEVEALRTGMQHVVREGGGFGDDAEAHANEPDEDPLIPFGGLTVRVRDDGDTDDTEPDHGDSPDDWAAYDGLDGSGRDAHA